MFTALHHHVRQLWVTLVVTKRTTDALNHILRHRHIAHLTNWWPEFVRIDHHTRLRRG